MDNTIRAILHQLDEGKAGKAARREARRHAAGTPPSAPAEPSTSSVDPTPATAQKEPTPPTPAEEPRPLSLEQVKAGGEDLNRRIEALKTKVNGPVPPAPTPPSTQTKPAAPAADTSPPPVVKVQAIGEPPLPPSFSGETTPTRERSKVADFVFGKRPSAEAEQHKADIKTRSDINIEDTLDKETNLKRRAEHSGIDMGHAAASRAAKYAAIGQAHAAAEKEIKNIASARFAKEIETDNVLVRGIKRITGGQLRSNARQNAYAEIGRRASGVSNTDPDSTSTDESTPQQKESEIKKNSSRSNQIPTYQNPDEGKEKEAQDTQDNRDITATNSRWLQSSRINSLRRTIKYISGSVFGALKQVSASANRLK